MQSIGDRMKQNYENRYRICLTRRTPVIIRLDGKAFHSLTRHCDKPFDSNFIDTMTNSAVELSRQLQGFKIGYIQSDEVSFLLTDYDTLQTEAYFDKKKKKIVSVTAAMMSVCFSSQWMRAAIFDARTFNIPESEIANYFLWRALDWQRNSVQMYAQAYFSAKQLHKKDQASMHEMLYSKGKNWAKDLSEREKNGVWLDHQSNVFLNIKPVYGDIEKFIQANLNKNEGQSTAKQIS